MLQLYFPPMRHRYAIHLEQLTKIVGNVSKETSQKSCPPIMYVGMKAVREANELIEVGAMNEIAAARKAVNQKVARYVQGHSN
jgi:hypothetical protein